MDFGPAMYPGSWLGLGRVRGWIWGGEGMVCGFVDLVVRRRRSEVRGFVDPWGGNRGFVDSWVRELVGGFVGSWIGSRAFGFVE